MIMIHAKKTCIVLFVKDSKFKRTLLEYVLKINARSSHAPFATIKYLKYGSVELR
jgi:hypothetical protein